MRMRMRMLMLPVDGPNKVERVKLEVVQVPVQCRYSWVMVLPCCVVMKAVTVRRDERERERECVSVQGECESLFDAGCVSVMVVVM